MANEVEIKKIKTPEFIGSFVNLAKARSIGDSDPRYSILMPLDENHKFVAKMRRLQEAVAIERWGKVPKRLKSAIKTGEDRDREDDEFAGKVTVNFASPERPGVVYFDDEGDLVQVDDPDMLYSGATYRLTTKPYAWEHPTGGKGVSWSLDNVLWVKGGERLSGKASPEQDFGNIEDDEDDDIMG